MNSSNLPVIPILIIMNNLDSQIVGLMEVRSFQMV